MVAVLPGQTDIVHLRRSLWGRVIPVHDPVAGGGRPKPAGGAHRHLSPTLSEAERAEQGLQSFAQPFAHPFAMRAA